MRLTPAAILASYLCNDLLLIRVEVHVGLRRGFAAAPLKADRWSLSIASPPCPVLDQPVGGTGINQCRSTSGLQLAGVNELEEVERRSI